MEMSNTMRYILFVVGVLFITLTACEDMNELHESWMEEGEINYVGKLDSVKVNSGDRRISFNCYISDMRVKNLTVSWSEFGVGKSKKVAIPAHEITEPVQFFIGDTEEIVENEYTFTFVSDDGSETTSIPVNTVGKVYGAKYQKTLGNRIVTSFELLDNGINLQFSSPLNADDKGVEVMYNNGTEDVTLVFTPEQLAGPVFIENPNFETPISYHTMYQPAGCLDSFSADAIVPSIEKMENVALNKPATSSATLNSSYTADKAVDGIKGDNASRWINARNAGVHWLEIDLEKNYEINKVIIHDDTPISDFKLQVEVDGAWQDLQVVTGNSTKKFTGIYDGVTGSKIRYSFETFEENKDDIIRMFELEVFSKITIQ
ncbi:hypothetical protein EMN47_01575 [Prolixibacteraceae bacterium JC049]|nr:hypothetical protein [Prolixibacteraceae bacterium JC049]